MEKYFIIIPVVAIVTVILLALVQIAFIKWTDKLFGIDKDKKDKSSNSENFNKEDQNKN
ncbi:MAG: hypothetical protein ACPL3A_05460 [Thermoanaerobacteraceae bacterium]